MRHHDRAILADEIAAARPTSVALAAGLASLIGAVAAHATSRALVPYPPASFPASKPVVILGVCLAVALAGLTLAAGLLLGRMGAWVASAQWAALAGAAAALMLGGRIRGGLSPGSAIALAPAHAALVALAAALLALLWRRRVRSWFATARRLRALAPGDLDRYLRESSPLTSLSGQQGSAGRPK